MEYPAEKFAAKAAPKAGGKPLVVAIRFGFRGIFGTRFGTLLPLGELRIFKKKVETYSLVTSSYSVHPNLTLAALALCARSACACVCVSARAVAAVRVCWRLFARVFVRAAEWLLRSSRRFVRVTV